MKFYPPNETYKKFKKEDSAKKENTLEGLKSMYSPIYTK